MTSQCIRQLSGAKDVARLRSFVPAGQQYHERRAPPDKVDPVSGAMVDAQLRKTATDGSGVSSVTKCESVNASQYSCSGAIVAQIIEPTAEGVGLNYFDRMQGSLKDTGRQRVVASHEPNLVSARSGGGTICPPRSSFFCATHSMAVGFSRSLALAKSGAPRVRVLPRESNRVRQTVRRQGHRHQRPEGDWRSLGRDAGHHGDTEVP